VSDDDDVLLEVHDLHTSFDIEGKWAHAVRGVHFNVNKNEVLGIVGESGSGKSVTALSIMRLIPDPPGRIMRGEINYRGKDLMKLSWSELRKMRGNDIAMIFQEPMTSLNPVMTIGKQVMEPLIQHQDLDKAEAETRAIEVLTEVGIPDATQRMADYPHQFSGGMRQRVMIAIALACKPSLLIADEPTTALDVTIQAQILDLMVDLQKGRDGASIILITHDLAVVAETCNRVLVMYGGQIQEVADVYTLFDKPTHPYTKGLLDSIPTEADKGKRLRAIPGNVPSIMNFPVGCRFCTRCPDVMDKCLTVEPPLFELEPGHGVRCHLVDPESQSTAAPEETA
jgi:oligopeptide/dipeptide ABC transporter ATP-binding protein